MNLDECLKLIRSFLSPDNKLDQTNLNEITLGTILNNVNDSFQTQNEAYFQTICSHLKSDEDDSYWKFAVISSTLLESLNDCSFEINENNCYISVKDELLLNKLVQLTVCFGIHYNLEDNVGVSIEKLSKYGANITKKREKIQPNIRNERLSIILNMFYRIKSKKRPHFNMISGNLYRKHLHDLIAALIQVKYSPNKSTQTNDFAIKWLNDLFDELDGSNLVSSLLISQSSCVRGSKRVADWFTIRIGNMLTSCLLRPNSVLNVVRAVLNEMDAVSNVTLESDWKKCDLIAQILCQCPRQTKIENYVELIGPQLLQLFFEYDQRFAKYFYRVGGSIYAQFAKRWPELIKAHFTDKILAEWFKKEPISSKEFLLNLNRLHLVYVSSTEPNWTTLSQLSIEIVHLIFQIYACIQSRINAKETRAKCKEILKLYFRMMPTNRNKFDYFVSFLKCELITITDLCHNCVLGKQFDFELFDEDESQDLQVIKTLTNNEQEVTIQMVEYRCATLTQLIKQINETETQIQFILYLFDEIANLIETPSAQVEKKSEIKKKTDQTLLEMEEKFFSMSKVINLKIVYFTQIASLIEVTDPQHIIDNHSKIIQFCLTILSKMLPIIQQNSQAEDNKPDEMIQLIFSIISVFTSGMIEIKNEIKQELQCLLPMLEKLKNIDPDSELAKMAGNFFISISTYCGVQFSSNSNKPPLIEEINSNQDEYSLALKDLNDPLVPVKAHGLVALRKLIDLKDETTLLNKTKVLEHFLNNIKCNDSYIYLAAVNGLISLALYEPASILDVLLNEYRTSKKLDIETRLKIGEALTRTVKNFNDLLPKYGNMLIDVFLFGCKHEEDLFRSSSLSNLGETCKLLNFSLHTNIHEIINCLSSLIDTDKSIQVKRSAAMVVKMIIEGLKQENFIQILGNSALPLYKVLSKTKSTSQDEIVQLNCQLSTEYLNDLMRSSLFPKQKLEKHIKISF